MKTTATIAFTLLSFGSFVTFSIYTAKEIVIPAYDLAVMIERVI